MTIQERVLKVIREQSHKTITADQLDAPFEELGIDSLDRTTILFGLEEEFQLNIPDAEARQYTHIRQIVERLTQYLEERASSPAGPSSN
jgi:acyl carrier protein